MRFKETLRDTWKEYTENFDAIFKIVIVLSLIPAFIIAIIRNLPEAGLALLITKMALLIPISLIGFLLTLYFWGTITKTPLLKQRYRFRDFLDFKTKEYLYFMGYMAVWFLFIMGLSLLLVVPGIIFAVYWIFGPYILFKEKKGILDSLEASRMLVRGRWWMVAGHTLLLGLILTPLYLIIWAPQLITEVLFRLLLRSSEFSFSLYLIQVMLSAATTFAYNLICIPLTFLFYKHLYLALRKKLH